MAFERPITIKEALEQIRDNRYLLPSIQREVVWSRLQIQRLFDSLMQGYPIGSFLFWKVREENSEEFIFYEFMAHFHEKKNKRLKRHDLPKAREVTGVLDGQQRLTALNIGFYGSHAIKLPYKWAEFDSNYPKTYLYLRLDQLASPNDEGMVYDFRFLTPDQAQTGDQSGAHWFRVGDIFKLEPGPGIFDYVMEHGLATNGNKVPFAMLSRLHDLVHKDAIINYYEEREQNLDKVLNIFIRINSGGTTLSKSDLLLSIATSQWKDIDARETIFELVDEINTIGLGFKFDKDVVLKAGLMLTEIPNVAFRVTNFNSKNMATLEENWSGVAKALRLATQLLASFGFSNATLSANSVLLPIAYYLYRTGADESYLTHGSLSADRDRVRTWVVQSLLKAGVWGSGLDQLLLAIRTALSHSDYGQFPVSEVRNAMLQRGKPLTFTEEEVLNLTEMRFGESRVFPFLSLLYPGMDFQNSWHVDHVYPSAAFSRAKLARMGVEEPLLTELMDRYNRLPNLQLLPGPVNQSKQDQHPVEWMEHQFLNDAAREEYRHRHLLGDMPESISEFPAFYVERQKRILQRAKEIIGFVSANSVIDEPALAEI